MSECIFCKIARGDAKSWKVYEDESVYAFLDIHPVNQYHTLVIPKQHSENIFDIPESDLVAVTAAIRTITHLYRGKLGIHNVQIINSSGSEAQQDVFHMHFHILPRHRGDRQDVVWSTHPEWVEDFDRLLEALR